MEQLLLTDVAGSVRTIPQLLPHSFIVLKEYQKARRANSPGLVVEILVGIVGRPFLVLHENNRTAVYEEAELLPEPACWRVVYPSEGRIMHYKEFSTHDDRKQFIEQRLEGVPFQEEGPFYSNQELTEGPVKTKDLFDHLLKDDL